MEILFYIVLILFVVGVGFALSKIIGRMITEGFRAMPDDEEERY